MMMCMTHHVSHKGDRLNQVCEIHTKFKDVRAQNVPTFRFFLNLPRRKVMIYFCQKGKKEKRGVTVLVFEILRCIFRRLRYFKTILAYTCQ